MGKWDWPLFLIVLALGSISLLVISAINRNLVVNQFIFWIIGLMLLWIVSSLDWRFWHQLTVPIYLLSILFLIILLAFGEPVRGSVRWLQLGIFRFQPSEIAKIAIILLLARFYEERLAENFKAIIASLLLVLPPLVLILIQPDIGNTLSLLGIWMAVSIARRLSLRNLLLLMGTFLLAVTFLFNQLAPYQKERIVTFLRPEATHLTTGYQNLQSKIAIGSGQLFGRGLGQGTQSQLKFLPETENDFIFAATVEQLGFVAGILILLLYFLMLWRILKLAPVTEPFGQLVAVGAVSYLIVQIFVNIAMNMGLLPVTGITLPLISYGGSSLIATLFILGIIFSIKKTIR